MKITKKALFAKMNGKRVQRKSFGIATANEQRESLQDQVNKINSGLQVSFSYTGKLHIVETENTFELHDDVGATGRFVMKSKNVAEETGVIRFRSNDFIFTRDRDGGNLYGSEFKKLSPLSDGSGFRFDSGEGFGAYYTLIEA